MSQPARKFKLLDTVFYLNSSNKLEQTYIVSTLQNSKKEFYLVAGVGGRIPVSNIFSPSEAAKIANGGK